MTPIKKDCICRKNKDGAPVYKKNCAGQKKTIGGVFKRQNSFCVKEVVSINKVFV